MQNNIPILLEIAQKMNATVELQEILPAIVDIAKEYMGVKRVSVFLKEGEKLSLKAYAGFEPVLPVVLGLGEGITGHVAQTGEQYMVNHSMRQDQDMGYKATSFLSLPIKTNNNLIGVLNLTDKFDDFFNESDRKMAEYIASQCSLAVERYDLYQRMRGAERMQAIGMLRASVAHDIKNLLGIVEVYLSLMEETPDKESIEEYMAAIRVEIHRVQGLAEDIMEYSKHSIVLKYSNFDLNELCTGIAKQLNLSLKLTKISVEEDIIGSLPVRADKERLFRTIFNLANNAVQAISEDIGGRVVIRARDLGQDVSITVCDNGKGIEKNIIKGIFDPFVTSGKAKGTGLGLAIVQEVTKAHGGTIKVRSAVGRYTLFRIVIPKFRKGL